MWSCYEIVNEQRQIAVRQVSSQKLQCIRAALSSGVSGQVSPRDVGGLPDPYFFGGTIDEIKIYGAPD